MDHSDVGGAWADGGRPAITLLGVPLEIGAGTPGCLMGPAALRTAGLAPLLRNLGFTVHDRGDLLAPPAEPSALAAADAARCRYPGEIAAWTRLIHDTAFAAAASGDLPVFLGGDHALSMGTVSGIARHCRDAGRELVVLWVDAHADFNTPATTPSGNMHGMPVAFLTGEPSLRALLPDRPLVPVPAGNLHLFGLRSIDAEERERLREHGIEGTDMRDIDEFGVAALLRERIGPWRERGVHLHVSFDIDVLDPSLAPGVGTQVAGGATTREAHLIMEMLHDSGLVGSVDIVELNPFLDERGRSAKLLVELVASLFGRTVLDRRPARVRAF
ncbi:arginase [Roseomonas sp. BN140053]|uniref:arginase n=1 Tax=Roseomonas sp. BN140053 TaxID=3391898 RepID=UPI0039E83E8B